jgi:hypothetical protein
MNGQPVLALYPDGDIYTPGKTSNKFKKCYLDHSRNCTIHCMHCAYTPPNPEGMEPARHSVMLMCCPAYHGGIVFDLEPCSYDQQGRRQAVPGIPLGQPGY